MKKSKKLKNPSRDYRPFIFLLPHTLILVIIIFLQNLVSEGKTIKLILSKI